MIAARHMDGPKGRLAYERVEGAGPGVVWLGGFRSDMTGTKASFLADWARRRERTYVRFDYSGHGASDGAFEDGCISDWTADALAVLDGLTAGPQILVGSSMGGWIATLLARARPERLAGLVYIAPAPDFTEELFWNSLDEDDRARLEREGRLELPSDYAPEPDVVTWKLIEDGRRNRVLGAPIDLAVPVRILQGMKDTDVPWRHAMRLAETIRSPDLLVTLTGDGDHRLSTPADLARLAASVESIG
ncbi:alpha/beta hydrolase [Amphiplicatus metriothermophilus]|uniref:Palmitoyl-protein thioesterase ABHD10, mitochondrial n=1 Tax=Amphiplicatus metriothermophilus TaxID=1519374 RepID=A0A239PLD8_9PROT|nr:alpha/beta hydrolase [Amphiplicatus metriothermophilus]SNT68385.1 Pimeloyl-ACP methyl ester carboxylesterase [Amphiplicatus metriothermophilus]